MGQQLHNIPRLFRYSIAAFVLLSIAVVSVVYSNDNKNNNDVVYSNDNKNNNDAASFLRNQLLRGSFAREDSREVVQRELQDYDDDFGGGAQSYGGNTGNRDATPQQGEKKKTGKTKKKKKNKNTKTKKGDGGSSAWGDYGADPLDSSGGGGGGGGVSSTSRGRDPYGGKEGSYGSYGSSSSSSSHSSYGSSSTAGSGSSSYGSSSGYGSTSSSGYGSSSSSSGYGSSSSSGYGSSSSSSSSYGGYGSSSYGGGSYGGSSSSGSWGGSKGSLKHKVSIPMWGIILGATAFIIATAGGMIYTAYQFERKPESMYANFCRLSINTVSCTYMVLYNLYHCRLSEVQAILMPDEEGDEYTDEEIERMKLRPGIAKALEREHNKAFRKNDARSSIELKKITRK